MLTRTFLALVLLLSASAAGEEPADRVADAYRRAGEAKAAGRHTESAAAWLEGARIADEGGDLAAAATGYMQAGLAARRGFDYDAAIAHWQELEDAQRRRGSADGQAAAFMNLGAIHGELGDYAQALWNLAAAERIYRDAGKDAGVGRVLGNRGEVELRQGRYRRAERTLGRAIALLPGDGEKLRRAFLGMKLAAVFLELGDVPGALERYRAERAVFVKAKYVPGIARSLGGIGRCHLRLGEHEKAVASLDAALVHFEARNDDRMIVGTLVNKAYAHRLMGDPKRARVLAESALERSAALRDPWMEANLLQNLGLILLAQGEHEEAVRVELRGLELAQRTGSDKLLRDGHRDLAKIALHRGDVAGAARAVNESLEAIDRMLSGLVEGQGALARQRNAEVVDLALSIALEADDPEMLFGFVEAGRARSLLESLEKGEEIREAAIPEALLAQERAARLSAAAAQAKLERALREDNLKRIRETEGELTAARDGLRAAIRRIRAEARDAADLVYPETASLGEVRATLGRDEAMVLYTVVGNGMFALVVTPEGARIARLGATTAIEPVSGDPDALGELLAKSLNLPPAARRVLVSPDGPLFSVPFGVVFAPREVVHVPSATTWRHLVDSARKRATRVLALGDTLPGEELPRLPFSKAEAQAVGDEVLLGKNASETELRRVLGKTGDAWRALHFACHAVVDPERPLDSMLAVTPDEENDGRLTALEVYRLRIPADLVVLSACESGRGRFYRGEGLVGFTRAFLFAGAPQVLCSLWKVDDRATQALMEKFYEHWKGGKSSAAAALRAAQEHVRKQKGWEHHRYWGAWTLWGTGT